MSDQAQQWAEASRRCPLSPEAAAMAKDLSIGPRDLISNIPASCQPWQAPVDGWVLAACTPSGSGGQGVQPNLDQPTGVEV